MSRVGDWLWHYDGRRPETIPYDAKVMMENLWKHVERLQQKAAIDLLESKAAELKGYRGEEWYTEAAKVLRDVYERKPTAEKKCPGYVTSIKDETEACLNCGQPRHT